MSLNGIRILVFFLMLGSMNGALAQEAKPFGDEFPNLDSLAVGEWWKKKAPQGQNPPPTMQVERDRVIAFAIYTVDRSMLKLTAQLYPLMPDETRSVRLEVEDGDAWKPIGNTDVVYPGWSAHFRIEGWDGTVRKRYRVRHGEHAVLEGTIRQDPIHKETIVVANMSCNSSRTTGLRPEILENLMYQDPDLLFFSGDQTYRHTEHTAGWIEFGLQFRDVLKDRPAITIPDDHDVGHPNLWGENGKRSITKNNADGGYFYPVEYVNMVQRQQTWHLPDPVDPAPVERGIGVYFTRYRLGGVDFAVLEDRKFKSGPEGKIPKMGPRPDHINDPSYDPKSIDLPGLELLGSRQLRFLEDWSQDWTGVTMKAVLSQTAFCGAVHMHGTRDGRLLADLDCNGWPQSGRNEALRWIRSAQAIHLCGDQHLAVVVQHGIDQWRDGPYAFTSPALVNTIYGRWWHPLDEKSGPNPRSESPLPWTGDFLDGLGNKISMLAYANPEDIKDERKRGDGYGIAKFHKAKNEITLECWPRFSDAKKGDSQQYPGWPITISANGNDGRIPMAWLPTVEVVGADTFVLQVQNEVTKEIVYTHRVRGNRFRPPVFSEGSYTIAIGMEKPDRKRWEGQRASKQEDLPTLRQSIESLR